jgi:beta-lactamase class A
MIGRRPVLAGLLLAAAPVPAADPLAALERRSRGRLGVSILDTATGRRVGYREDERFPMCSTFKLLAAAHALSRVDHGLETLDREVEITAAALVPGNSPTTQPQVGGTLNVEMLCEAAMIVSDNTAANLLLASGGGPAGLTAFVRTLGDRETRLDRIEPELNVVPPGDPRDTTTPAAMVGLLQRLVLGTVLSPASRKRLTAWLLDNRTGGKRLRAGLPAGWRIGDKTGTWEGHGTGTSNDVAVIWPNGRAPLLVSAYLTSSPLGGAARDAVLADVGRFAASL